MANALPAGTVRYLVTSLVTLFVTLGLLLFVPAGTLNWPLGWTFVVVLAVMMIVTVLYMAGANPEIFEARRGIGEGTKSWDFVILALIVLGFFAVCPVAAIDTVRLGNEPLSMTFVVLGYIAMAVAFAGQSWSQAVNRHFEPSVRIQSERDHKVIDTGPYAYVRHPGYITGSLLGFGIAWALGSAWAQIPALLLTLVLLVRTELEDKTLQAELPGYADYARRVRRKWVPGIY